VNEPHSRARLLLVAALGYLVVLGYASAAWAAGSRHGSWWSTAWPLTAGAAAATAVVLTVETVAGWLYRQGQLREAQNRARSARRCGIRWGHFAHYWGAPERKHQHWCDGEGSQER
jgi:hypothetical protein